MPDFVIHAILPFPCGGEPYFPAAVICLSLSIFTMRPSEGNFCCRILASISMVRSHGKKPQKSHMRLENSRRSRAPTTNPTIVIGRKVKTRSGVVTRILSVELLSSSNTLLTMILSTTCSPLSENVMKVRICPRRNCRKFPFLVGSSLPQTKQDVSLVQRMWQDQC